MFASRIGGPLVERDRGDRAGGVAADAGQRLQRVDVARKLAGVFGDDFFARRVQLPRAAVVAETFPQSQHLLFVGGGERVNVGKRRDEPL